MQAGKLRYRVSIQRPLRIQNDAGEVIVDQWAEIARVWAAIEAISGREYMASSEFRAGITTRIRIRWRSDVDATARVVAGDGTIYSIDVAMPVKGLTRELHLMCSTGVITEGGQP
ncbi:SPP1 family predicted phage head-tail adaptor [Paraburkholderia sp. UCT70]|uniref:phage head closure protein n=1 Tax=Paraburkholderia sp. UCT70 TaxID=2991068 RepID=UPI003D1C3FEB